MSGRTPRLAAAAATLAAVGALAVFLILDRALPFPWHGLERPPATLVLDRQGEPLRVFLPADGILRIPVRLDEVAPEMRRALVWSEDRRFGRHPGVDPLALARALVSNLRAGRVVSGASTIPMQLARLVEPRPRTLSAKAIEAFRALQLVWHLESDAILEHYLNLAPFGGNLEGIGAASFAHFGVGPDELSLGEAALLTALPRAPSRTDPARNPAAARRARDRVLAQLARSPEFPAADLEDARRQPLPERRRALPFRAPHFARFAAARAPGQARVATSLDARVQRVAESLVRTRAAELRRRGIGNAAAVVIELETRALRAMVGSAEFFDRARPGQVNGAMARRSPGSTLKPFLYALAFDDGRLVPDSWVLDLPTDFSGYVAENYDGVYRGRMSAAQALIESRNAPAVRLLAETGLGRFHALLRRGGLRSLDRGPWHYGLPLVLGAAEVTLLELTNLYATLGDGGLHRPVHWRAGPREPGERLFSPAAAHLAAGVLSKLERPDLPRAWDLTRQVPAVAWKTGTSYGHRDAWAVGFAEHLAIGVWVGNLDGSGRRGISGAEHAAPLLFDLFRALDPLQARRDPPRPAGLTTTEVCALSHELPGPFCPLRTRVASIRGVSQLPACSQHRRVFLDRESGERLAGDCLGRRPHRAQVLEVFPAELVAWWRGRGQPVAGLPPLHAGCRAVPGGAAPRIVSPAPRTPYRLRRGAPAEFQKLELAARAAPGTSQLYWYQDGRLLASAPPDRTLFATLEPGWHRLVVVDDAGRSHSIHYQVE